MSIRENVKRLLSELPAGVEVVAAAKGRSLEEIIEAVDAGVRVVGENYVQEAEQFFPEIGNRVKWHFIGHLQRNKVKKAVQVFDMIETVDSIEIAQEIAKRSYDAGNTMPVLLEINSACEDQKSGVFPENAEALLRAISTLSGIEVLGLMTMGPLRESGEELRPFFTETRALFKRLQQLQIPNVKMTYLSMGMSNSYNVAIEEGANIVRIGERIFEGAP